VAARSESEVIAQQVSVLSARIETLENRLEDVDKVIDRLEGAALTTARALQEISSHWDAVYEAMRRAEDSSTREVGSTRSRSRPSKRTA
jgi:uncharacterized coiled-coil protein SlyX